MRFPLALLAVVAFLGLTQTSCAVVRPIPGQTLTCIKAELTPANFAAAGQCIASNPALPAIEACLGSLAVADGISLGICEANAIASDVNHARQVAMVAGADPVRVQATAQAYLQAKGVAVTVQAPTPATSPPSP